jgi:hypothetical protein
MRSYAFAGLVAASAALAPAQAIARPVTYPGGDMSMLEYKDETYTVETMRTLTPKFAVGWHDEWDAEGDRQFHGPMIAGLAKRWNNPDSQANIFWMAGAGAAFDDVASIGGKARPAGYVGVEADWENRRFYTQYSARAYWSDTIDKTLSQRFRVGVAPYVAEAGALHTWAILQIDHEAEQDHPVTVTPVIRLFKGGVLGEAGVSVEGDGFAGVMFYF